MSTLIKVKHETYLYVDPDNGVLYVRENDNGGKRRTKSVGARVSQKTVSTLSSGTQAEVKTALRKYRSAIQKTHAEIVQGVVGVKSRVLFEDLWQPWLDEMKPTWRPGTYKDKEEKGRLHLLPFFGRYKPHEVDEALWKKYVSHKKKTKPTLKLKNHRQYLSEYLHHLHRNKVIDRVPELNNPDGEIEPKVVFTRKQAVLLQRYANPDLRLQIRMGLLMGMRLGEVLKLRWDRVDFKGNMIRLKAEDTKTKKARNVPMAKSVRKALQKRFKERETDFVFPSPTRPNKPVSSNKTAWNFVADRLGVDAGFHSLRHTCATRMAASNIAPSHACRILGMSLEVYDRIYCKPTEADLNRSIDLIDWRRS